MSKCTCPGRRDDKWHRWRAIHVEGDRPKTASGRSCIRLYCLDCHREWWSRANYAVLIRDHEPRRRSRMSDGDVLQLIREGRIRVDPESAEVFGVSGRKLAVSEKEAKQGGRYRFVCVSHGGEQRRIALHRIVWMASNMRVVPDGYHIDHVNSQEDDTIQNLRLLDAKTNCSLGAAKSNARREAWSEPGELEEWD